MDTEKKVVPQSYPSPFFFQWLVAWGSFFLLRLRGKIVVEGIEHIQNLDTPVIFASNHTSDWDAPVLRWAIPCTKNFTSIFYVSAPKKSFLNSDHTWLQRVIYGGAIFRLLGAYPVEYGAPTPSDALRIHIAMIRDGRSMVIFPEGRRVRGGDTAEFKRGVIWMAWCTGAPVVPVAVDGLDKVRFASLLRTRLNPIRVRFGPPILYASTPDLSIDDGDIGKREVEELRNVVVQMRTHSSG